MSNTVKYTHTNWSKWNKRLTRKFLIPSWNFSFSKNDWKKSDLSTCLGATQRASISAPNEKRKSQPELVAVSHSRPANSWVKTYCHTFCVNSKSIGTKCEYFTKRASQEWRWEVLLKKSCKYFISNLLLQCVFKVTRKQFISTCS